MSTGKLHTEEVVKYIMVTTSRRVRKLRSLPVTDEGRKVWFGKKEKSLIPILYFGKGLRCPGKD